MGQCLQKTALLLSSCITMAVLVLIMIITFSTFGDGFGAFLDESKFRFLQILDVLIYFPLVIVTCVASESRKSGYYLVIVGTGVLFVLQCVKIHYQFNTANVLDDENFGFYGSLPECEIVTEYDGLFEDEARACRSIQTFRFATLGLYLFNIFCAYKLSTEKSK